jgi:hypothetical protein
MKRLLSAFAIAFIANGCMKVSSCVSSEPVLSYQFDISRSKVPTMATAKRMVDFVSSLGYNQFQLYTENTFKYEGHQEAWEGWSPFTPAEIRELDSYASSKGVELVPNQNSFGHMEKWLKLDKYSPLAQSQKLKSALCPTNEASIKLLESLYDQLLPCFKSKYFNVGCDEVEGVSQQDYLDFLNKIHSLVTSRGHTMMYWADIVLHDPTTIGKVPHDAIALNWGYSHDYDFEKSCALLKETGFKFYVCPGTSAWCSLVGQTTNMIANVKNAVAAGRKNGAVGYMMADWGDGGYVQPWLISIPSIIMLADYVKRDIVHTEETLAERIDELLSCRIGKSLIEMGKVDRFAGLKSGNNTVLWRMLRKGKQFGPIAETRPEGQRGVSKERMRRVFVEWDKALSYADLTGASEWIKDDFSQLKLLRKALEMRVNSEHDKVVSDIRPEYSRLWLKYYRPGGLEDSLLQNLSETIPAGFK